MYVPSFSTLTKMATRMHLCFTLFLLICLFIQNGSSTLEEILHDVHVHSRHVRQDTDIAPFLQRIWDFHQYYQSNKETQGADWYWQELSDDHKHHKLSDSKGGYDEVYADFEFEFYGHTIKRIYLSTAGILSMSPFDDDLPVTHYIAPFYGAFDLSIGKDSAIYFESRAGKFIAEWRNVYLRNHTELGAFNFQAQVLKDGQITFVYKRFQLPQNVTMDKSEFLIGIVGSINIDIAGIKILAYYDPVQVFPLDISNGTVVNFYPLATCDTIRSRQDCENKITDFDCKWCNATKRCVDGLDRYTQEWNTSGCLQEELNSGHLTKKPGHVPTTAAPKGSSSSRVGVIIVIVVVIVIVAALVGWIVYAYKNPQSKSGIWLMEHRPSQWKNMFAARKGFSRHAEEQPQY